MILVEFLFFFFHIFLIFHDSELDIQTNNLINKLGQHKMGAQNLVHLNCCLSRDTSFKDLIQVRTMRQSLAAVISITIKIHSIMNSCPFFILQEIRKCFGIGSDDNETFRFGIIGLHPCGDLASILIKFFLDNAEPKFLNLVGCCYFKITTSAAAAATNGCDANKNGNGVCINGIGYPLSDYFMAGIDAKRHHLSFEAREIACHAIEVYAMRLSQSNYDNLRVHSYRAAIEKIICKYWPERKHCGLRSIKRLTTFREYCKQAVCHLDGVHIPDIDIDSDDTIQNLNNWKCVVIFYTLRLMLAPIIESVILYDRMLCLLERGSFQSSFLLILLICLCNTDVLFSRNFCPKLTGCQTTIEAIFDPFVSARNHITTAIRSWPCGCAVLLSAAAIKSTALLFSRLKYVVHFYCSS